MPSICSGPLPACPTTPNPAEATDATDATDATIVVFASEFVAPSWRDFIAVARRVPGIVRQLRTADGMLSYRLDAHVRRRRMTTVSAWRDERALSTFVTQEPHRSAMTELRGRIGTPRFATAHAPTSAVRLDPGRYLDAGSRRTLVQA